jgi:hypothetical protein
MTPGDNLLASIAQAEKCVEDARRHWNAASVEQCEQCAEQLHHAIELMLSIRQAAAQSAAIPDAKVRLQCLRDNLEELSRLVDSAMAFSRGLALRMISEEPVCAELKG